MKRTALVTLGLLTLSTAFAQTTITGFFADVNPNWANMQDDVGKEITKRTGVVLKAEFAVGDPDQKINLIAASGQYPDIIAPKGAAGVLIDADAVLDLTTLINKNAPNIKKVIGKQFNRMKFSNKNQGIYFIPNNDTIGQVYFDNDALFKLQLQALKEQKYPRVKTLKDFEKVIADYVKKHPKTADGKPTIGLSLLADDWRFVISVTNPATFAMGSWDDGEWAIDPKTYKAMPHHFRPEDREYFRWLNHMNDIGLLDKESFTQKYDQYLAKIASGRVVGLIDAGWDIGDAVNSLKAAGKHEQMYGRFGAVLKPGIKAAYNAPTGFRGGYGVGITKSAKDPVKILKFLDFLSSDEGQVLINWGIEGKHHKVVNGKREFLPKYEELRKKDPAAFQRETGIGNYGLSLRYGDGVKDKTGNYYTTNFPEQILENYTDAEKAALKAYKVKFWGDLLPKASQFKPIPWAAAWSIPVPQDSALSEFWTKEQEIVRKYIPKAILADPKEFDKIYDEMLNVMDKQLGKYNVLMTQLVQDRLKLWGVLK
ncbi:ABC transporter substrate-binding protein [Deinococcus cellulosilyticus]|uniref:ABC transporter substrate-binding protein n=1 Tax=Deinococcus cellulosilyticus (strain DSM 18568 / NBRC 106333 / KACC 11606 / 5516J-15) TaxID=1223518 RepID=A0A511N8U1_DEIC1|nr:ABC transporter substrate-binding protein [Deinococcus cellulosilyticus]GEM49273.1 ABC transporter substrate-binding protein [Deinococcus cellulosilyticus NBRC 106333 = KACC 11606]